MVALSCFSNRRRPATSNKISFYHAATTTAASAVFMLRIYCCRHIVYKHTASPAQRSPLPSRGLIDPFEIDLGWIVYLLLIFFCYTNLIA